MFEIESGFAALVVLFILTILPALIDDLKVVGIAAATLLAMGAVLLASGQTFLPFSILVAMAIAMFFSWLSGQVLADVRRLIRDEEVSLHNAIKSAAKAGLYVVPAVLVVWTSFDIAALIERRVMYGCSATQPMPNSLYGIRSYDTIFWGRYEKEDRFALAMEQEERPLWYPDYQEGPLFAFLNWQHWQSPEEHRQPCADFIQPADHEQSALQTVTQIKDNLSLHLKPLVTQAMADAKASGRSVEEAIRLTLFGEPGHGCNPSTRGAMPDDGECVFGRLPRSCGAWRWIRKTGQCFERMGKKPIIRTYERVQHQLLAAFMVKIVEAGALENQADANIQRVMDQFIDVELGVIAKDIRWSILFWFAVLKVMTWMGILSAVSLLAKSYLTMFSRAIFTDEKKLKTRPSRMSLMSVEERAESLPIDEHVQIRPVSQSAQDGSGFRTIALDLPDNTSNPSATWYVYDNCGVAWSKYGRAILVFRLLDAWIRRLLAGKAAVHKIEPVGDTEKNTGRIQHDLEVVALDLRPQQRVIVDMGKVLGFQGNVRFKVKLIPRLGAFFQSKLRYTTAFSDEGAGTILFYGEGRAIGTIKAGGSDGLVDGTTIAAMDICGTYHGAASMKAISPYYRPITLGPADKSTVMIAANPHTQAAFGLWPRVKGMLWYLWPV